MNDPWTTLSRPVCSQTAKVLLGFTCNNRCVFCFDRHHKDIPAKTTREVRQEISSAFRQGFPRLLLMGGEPTVREDILELIAHARKTGFRDIMLTTNGRMLVYRSFARALVKSKVSQIVFSLHGPAAGVHDALTCSPGSFDELMQGVENLKKEGARNLGVNTTIVTQNYRHLSAIADIFLAWGIQRAEFIYVAAERRVFRQVTPKVSQAAASIRGALEKGRRNGHHWGLVNAPLPCYFWFFFDHLSFAGGENNTSFAKTKKAALYQKAEARKRLFWTKREKCDSCSRRRLCRGISKSYLREFGDGEVKPLR